MIDQDLEALPFRFSAETMQTLWALRFSGYVPRTLLDVGAHVGVFATTFRKVFPDCALTLMEPNPHCAEKLARLEGELVPVAASDSAGTGILFLTNETLDSTGASLYREKTQYFSDEKVMRHEVDKGRIDDLFAGRSFDFVKIDIQGSELDALRGGEAVIRQADYILIEITLIEYNEGEPTAEEVIAQLRKMGFRCTDILEFHRHDNLYDGSLIQVDMLLERMVPRPKQGFFYAPLNNNEKLLSFLKDARQKNPDFTVIDIGGKAQSWPQDLIDAHFSGNAGASKLHFPGDLNDPRAWQPLLDHVARHGKFSYSICSNVLQGIAYPALTLKMLPQISHCGYIAVPSMFNEFLRHGFAYRGHLTHRWIFDFEDGDLLALPKLPLIEHLNVANENEIWNDRDRDELQMFWRGNISCRILGGDYPGLSSDEIVNTYLNFLGRKC